MKNRGLDSFDTTISGMANSPPGCSMNVPEKLRMAAKLVELGVDSSKPGSPHRIGMAISSGGRRG